MFTLISDFYYAYNDLSYAFMSLFFFRKDPDLMHLAVVVCGTDRVAETIVMFKSALLFARRKIHLHVFADDETQPLFRTEVQNKTLLSVSFRNNAIGIKYYSSD